MSIREYLHQIYVRLDTTTGRGSFTCTGCDTVGNFRAADRQEALAEAGSHIPRCERFRSAEEVPGTLEIDGRMHGEVIFNARTGKASVTWPEEQAPDDVPR